MTSETPLRPTFFFAALGLDEDFDANTSAEVKSAYANLASNGMHPDHGGDAAKWTLITAAYNELKAIYGKKRGKFTSNSDMLWLRNYLALHGMETPKADKPKAEKTAAANKWGVEPRREDESKDDYRKRYARETQQAKYAADPDYAQKRREASLRSHAKKRAADKAAKDAAAE